MESSNDLPRHIEDVEILERYCHRRFHPITIGDHLHGRYRIVHKLGFGAYSTVWLARDERADRYVAIKIAIAQATAGDSQESTIVRSLGDKVHPWKHLILPTLDEFFLTGPNGNNQCIVTMPARMTVAKAQDASYCTACSSCHRCSTHPSSILFTLSRNCSRW